MLRTKARAPSTAQLGVLVAVSVFAWSFGPICVRFAFQYDVPPALVAFGRMITGTIIFAPYILYRGRREIREMSARSRWLAGAAGTLFGINITLMATSLTHISIMINQTLIATIPIWVAVFEVTLLKGALSRAIWAGIAVALAGGILVAFASSGAPPINEDGNPGLGVLLAAISACSAALYITIGRKVRSTTSFIPYIWLVYTAGSAVTLLIIGLNRVSLIGYDIRGYLWVLLLAILAQIIGHGALNFVLKYVSPTVITVTAQAMPVLATVWALVIFSEIPTAWQALGSALLLLGVTIVLRSQRPRPGPTN